jgi:hypothetical protein
MSNIDFYTVQAQFNNAAQTLIRFILILNLNILFTFSIMTLMTKEHGELLKVTAATCLQPDSEAG